MEHDLIKSSNLFWLVDQAAVYIITNWYGQKTVKMVKIHKWSWSGHVKSPDKLDLSRSYPRIGSLVLFVNQEREML